MYSPVPSIRSKRNAELEAELKEYDEAQKKSQEETDVTNETEDSSSEQQKGGDPTSPATSGWEKRYADLRSASQKRDNERIKEIDDLKKQLAEVTKQEIEFPTTEDELDEWCTKYPQIAAIIETIALKKVKGLKEEIDQTKQTWEEEKLERQKQIAFSELMEAHPDFLDLRETEEFHTWAEGQAKWVRDALYENETDSKSVIDAVDLFKMKTGKASKKAQPKSDDRKDAARSVTNKTQSPEPEVQKDKNMIYESDLAKMDRKEYDRRAKEIDLALAEGRFVYDLSYPNGAAR